MQKSNINPSIKYIETTKINENDNNQKNIQVYEILLLDVSILICTGNFNLDIDTIIYVPIYLVHPTKFNIIKQIGIFEFEPQEIDLYKSGDDKLILENIKSPPKYPIIYSFVSKELLDKYKTQDIVITPDDDDDDNDDDDESIKKSDESIKKSDESIKKSDESVKKNDADDGDVTIKLNPELNDGSLPWFAFFFNDIKFRLHNVLGDGDCFFTSVSDAYLTMGENKSVKQLRTILAENITNDIFTAYKNRQLEIQQSIDESIKENELMKQQISLLKKQFKEASNIDTKKKITTEIKQYKEKIDINNFDISNGPELLGDFKWIMNINSLEQLREFIKKTADEIGINCYWADEVAITILESELNVKFIIIRDNDTIRNAISSSNLHNMDPLDALEEMQKNSRVILDCGERLEKNGVPLKTINSPEYYIILDHQGNHYELIKYQNKGMFTFLELPQVVKDKIIQRCVEFGTNSKYSQIPEFIKLANEYKEKNPPVKTSPVGSYDSPPDSQKSIDASIDGLFDENIQFLFYKGSANRKPGQGTGEKINIPASDIVPFNILDTDKFKDWRKKLSDTFEDSNMFLEIDGKKYKSIHEFYLKNKLLPKDKDKTPYDLDKTLVHRALLTKFRDNNQEPLFLKDLLLATKNAKLLKYNRGQEPTVALDLMYLRKKLSE